MNLIEEIDEEYETKEESEDCEKTEYDDNEDRDTSLDDKAWQLAKEAFAKAVQKTREGKQVGNEARNESGIEAGLCPSEGIVEPVRAEPLTVMPKFSEATQETPWRSSVKFVEEVKEEIEWLIPGVLPAGAVVLLPGREGSMKSRLAMSMAQAVAAGGLWLGKRAQQGPVLYLDGEMPSAVLKDYLRGVGPVDQLHVWTWTDRGFPEELNDNDSLMEAAKTHKLIVVDTLRRQMKDRNENSSDDMAQMSRAMRKLTRYGATVLALHHAPKRQGNKGPRGATELAAGVDISMHLEQTKKSDSGCVLKLEIQKTRYSDSEDLVIQVTKGDRAPVFALNGPTSEQRKPGLLELSLLIDDLRERSGRDPIQAEVIEEADKAALGGKDKIRGMLKEGEGRYWREQGKGREKSYAPPL